MRRFFKYLIVRPLLALLVVLLIALVLVGLLASTQTGTGLLVSAAQRFLPALAIEGESGYLADKVKADKLTWEQDTLKVAAENATFDVDINPFQVPPSVMVQELSADTLRISLKPTDDETDQTDAPLVVPDINLPIALAVNKTQVGRLIVEQDGKPIVSIRDVNLSAYTEGNRLYLEELYGDLYDEQGSVVVQASGEMGLLQPHDLSLQATVEGKESQYGTGELVLLADGELQNYQLQVDGHWQYQRYPDYELALKAQGSFEAMTIESLALNGEQGDRLSGAGQVTWKPQLAWDVALQGEHINPAVFAPEADIAGDLALQVSSSGEIVAGEPTLAVQVQQLAGTLRDYPVQATLDGRIEQGQITLQSLAASVGDNRLQASGGGSDNVNIDWQIDAPELSQLAPQLQGRLAGQGSLAAKLDGSQFALDIADLEGKVLDYPVQASGGISLQDGLLSARDLQAAVGNNQITLNGVADESSGIDWQIDAEQLAQLHPSLSGRLQGKGNAQGLLDGSRLAVRIDELEGQVLDYPLQASGSVRLQDQALSAQNLVLNVGENQIKLDGVATESAGMDWLIDAPQLAQLHPELSGQLTGRGNLQGQLDGSSLNVKIDALEGQVKDFPIDASGTLSMQDQVLAADNVQLAVGANTVRLDGSMDEQRGIDWTLEAQQLGQFSPELSGNLQGRGNLQGKLDGSRLVARIDNLQGQVQDFPVQASGTVSVRDQVLAANNLSLNVDDNRIRLDGTADQQRGLDWTLDANNLSQFAPQISGQLQGRGNLQGKLDGSSLAVRIDALEGQVQEFPINASGTVRLEDKAVAADNLRLSVGDNYISLDGTADEQSGLAWTLEANNLAQLAPQVQGRLQGNGKARLVLDGSRVALTINDLQGQVQDFPVRAQGTVRLQDEVLSVEQLMLAVGDNRIRLDGALDEQQGVVWQLEANQLAQFSPAVSGQLSGNGRIQGVLDGSRITLSINTLQGRVQEFPVQASGQVSLRDQRIAANNLLVNVGQNQLRLDGGSQGDNVALNWQLNAMNLTQLAPQIRGSVKGNGTLEGKVDGSLLTVTIARLNGQLEGRPLQAKGSIRWQEGALALQQLQVVAGQNVLVADGRASAPFDLTWRLNARNLAQVWPGLGGNIQGQGTVRGQLPQLQLDGRLQGSQVVYQDIRIGQLDATVSQRNGQYNGRVALTNVVQGDNVLQSAQLTGQGTVTNHAVSLSAVHEAGRLDTRVRGAWQNQQWRGVIETLALRDTPAGDWRLANQVSLTASAKAASLSEACLVSDQSARVCAQANWQTPAGLTASGRLQQVPLNMAKPFLPDTVRFGGVVNGDFQFEQRGGRPYAQANIRLPDNTVTITTNNRPELLRYSNAAVSATLNDRVATLKASLDVVGRGQVRAEGRVNLSPNDQQHRIEASAQLDIPDISWLQAFSPQIDELKGQLNGDVRVTGLLTKPQITGSARLQNGSVYLVETGARLEAITLTAQAVNAEQIALSASLRAGNGTLNASGALRLADLPNWQGSLQVQGERLLLMNTAEVQMLVSPDLNILASPKAINITGRVLVPEGDINLEALPESAKVRSDDIVIIRNSQEGQRSPQTLVTEDEGPPLDIRPNVVVELGNQVKLNAFGLDARLAGRLRVLRNRQDIVAEGALNVVDGYYQSYGQDLRIERGRILFNGPMTNPGLDIRAVREIDNEDITVGIAIGGTAEQPESSLFSNPPLTQTDTLSYLLTGRAMSGVSGGDSAMLLKAVTGLGISGGETLAQNLGSQLGLDDVSLDTSSGDYRDSELALGKRLGSNLYLKYIVGLFDSMQRVAVNYQINKRLELEATSGVQQSVDLIYKIDTDFGPFGE